MLKAGALYFAIVIAFMIAVISASLIMLAAHYRNAYLKEIRYDRLLNNLNSGLIYALADEQKINDSLVLDLYGDGTDSLLIRQKKWGIFELTVLQTFIQQDTLKKAFLIGTSTDSTALYLSDEDRPLAVSGQTKITGNVKLPKAGIKQAYAEGKPYEGKELVYEGKITNSDRTLNQLDVEILAHLKENLSKETTLFPTLAEQDLSASFLRPTKIFKIPASSTLSKINLKGNVILYSDSVVNISADAQLDHIQIYAKSIIVADGFKGSCQLFATDSISVGKNAVFDYPSVLGVIRTEKSIDQPQIAIGEKTQINGIVFTFEDKRSAMQTFISLAKEVTVKGEVYGVGIVKLSDGVAITGKVSCNRFLMQSPVTLYENFLINIAINRKARSKYYLSSKLFSNQQQNHILQWLN